ncbi:hypothetical protein LT42_00575 [Pseudomonas lutea]|uniref:Uncharacterized protein n=1 Tax=Pseudomonas lutea TaxID=243924 RepID=A0A9X0JJ62_9PSED|nr:hypothetical protein LT42_00575 [Pseudomonas lutea]
MPGLGDEQRSISRLKDLLPFSTGGQDHGYAGPMSLHSISQTDSVQPTRQMDVGQQKICPSQGLAQPVPSVVARLCCHYLEAFHLQNFMYQTADEPVIFHD